MIKYILLFGFVCFNSFSQQLQVEYYENRIIKNPDELKQLPKHIQKDFEPNRFGYTLTYIDGISVYKNKSFLSLLNTSTEPTTEILDLGDGEVITFVGTSNDTAEKYKAFEKLFFKDYLNKKMYAELFNNEKKQITDNLIDWQWEITDERKEINGYVCTKAITEFYGYNCEAWFAEEIPVSAGPEKFDGLPGLILYVKIGSMEFVAKSVKFIDDSIDLQKPVFVGKTYTFEELINEEKSNQFKFKPSIERDRNTNTIKQTITF